MIASFSNRFVFIHVPKNGGTSVRDWIKALNPRDRSLVEGWGKTDGRDLAHLFPSGLKRYFPAVRDLLEEEGTRSLAVLRDPLARCISAFHEHQAQYGDHPKFCETLMEFLDHVEMGHYREGHEDGLVFIHGAPQHEFLLENGKLVVKHLLRLEDPLFQPKLSLLMGAVMPLESLNPSSGRRVYLESDEVRRILEIYAEDYEFIRSLGNGKDSPIL